MSDKQTLLDAAALLVKLATKEDVATDPKLAKIIADWNMMLKQFEDRKKPKPWQDWTSGVLPSDVGDNTPESPFYEKFKSFWTAMERERVLDSKDRPFNTLLIRKEGGWPAFEAEIKRVAKTPEGITWFNDPLNKDILPKSQDMLLLA